MNLSALILTSLLLVSCSSAQKNEETAATKIAEVPKIFFVSPKDGDTVPTKFKVIMGASGIQVAKAGEMTPNTGHHHLIINGGPIDKGMIVPTDKKHMHFGQGQTETEVELKPGKYTLTLQFADGAHQSYGQDLSDSIRVTVSRKIKKQ